MKLETKTDPQILKSKTPISIIALFVLMFLVCVLLLLQSVVIINCQRAIKDLNGTLQNDLMPRLHKVDKIFDQAEKIREHIQTRYRKSEELATEIAYAIVWAGRAQGMSPELIAGVIEAESSFRTGVVSRAGCRGLMQLSRDKLADGEWRNIWKNIWVGTQYLKTQYMRFGRVDVALCAYNSGPNHPRKMIVSRGYVRRVRWYQQRLEGQG